VPKHFAIVSLLALTGLCAVPQPVYSQALVPYAIQLDEENLEQQGEYLFHTAIEAFQRGAYSLEQTSTQIPLASQLSPQNPQILAALGELYKRLGKFDDAVQALTKAKALDPENPAILFELGTVYLRQEQYQQAVNALEQGLTISPNIFGALFDLGNAYYKLGNYESAIASYEEAIDVQEDLWYAVNNIGLVLYEQNDTEAAIDYWQQAIDMTNGEEAEPLLALAVAQFQLGQRNTAIEQGLRALRLDQSYADLEFLRENLWGDRLLGDTTIFLNLPRIQSNLSPDSVSVQTSPHNHP